MTEQPYDKVIPITKLIVFTEHQSSIRPSERRISGALSSVAGRATHESFLVEESTISLLNFEGEVGVIHPLAVSK